MNSSNVTKWLGESNHWLMGLGYENAAISAAPRASRWTPAKVAALPRGDVRQLRANAERLGQEPVVALCDEVLASPANAAAPEAAPARKRKNQGRRLVSRSMAFGMCGVSLENQFWSRSGVTSKGKVVFALWAEDVRHDRNGSRCLLWAPNVDSARPWSDTPGGQERLEHCRAALRHGEASGLLVYGTRLQGVQPEDRAATVDGVDPAMVLPLRIGRRGAEFWAYWGGKAVGLA